MDEQEQLKYLERLHEDKTLHPVYMTNWDMWQLFEVCTLTLTHPELPEYSQAYYTDLAKQLEQHVLEDHPDLAELAKACWNRTENSPIDAEIKRKLRKRYR